jgi:hypothetical protein
MSTPTIRQIAFIALAGLISVGLWGCVPKQPKVERQQPELQAVGSLPQFQSVSEQTTTTGPANSLGSFNLQQRHGLGGWSKPAGPSEQELLKRLASASGPAAKSPLSRLAPHGKESR